LVAITKPPFSGKFSYPLVSTIAIELITVLISQNRKSLIKSPSGFYMKACFYATKKNASRLAFFLRISTY